MSAVRKI